jgi:hypothetical protein
VKLIKTVMVKKGTLSMKKLCVILTFLMISFGYQSTYAAEDLNSYTTISEGVRSVTLVDQKGGIIGKRFELYDSYLEKWFEAEKNGNGYKLTEKGQSDKEAVKEEAAMAGSC